MEMIKNTQVNLWYSVCVLCKSDKVVSTSLRRFPILGIPRRFLTFASFAFNCTGNSFDFRTLASLGCRMITFNWIHIDDTHTHPSLSLSLSLTCYLAVSLCVLPTFETGKPPRKWRNMSLSLFPSLSLYLSLYINSMTIIKNF